MQSAVTKGSLWLPLVVSVALAASGCAGAAEEAVQKDLAKMHKALEQSVQEFRKVFVNSPRGRQVPTALYKEAPLAREHLKNLGE